MIYVGIDDTDTLDDPGTNQLARHVVRELAGRYRARMNIRHQLLEDPRVPCTNKNGCVSIQLEPVESAEDAGWAPPTSISTDVNNHWAVPTLAELIDTLRQLIVAWCPKGSDPGFCVADRVPQTVISWGLRCKRELVTQPEARCIAADSGLHLEGLGGTEDGVIGALAAIGLCATKNDGRVVYFGAAREDWYDVTGLLAVEDILSRGVDEVRTIEEGNSVLSGMVDVGKRLRPNYRHGNTVLYVARCDDAWEAVRVL